MEKIYILCVDDEPDVLEAVTRDLSGIEEHFPIEPADSAADARELMNELKAKGDHVGLILCDYMMPGEDGVDLLISMEADEYTEATRKVLLTGQAGLEATVEAVNRADLSHYIAKPWETEDLLQVVRSQLTEYFLETGLDPMPYAQWLDPMLLARSMHRNLSGDR